MYQLIATKKKYAGQQVQPFWIVKTYKTLRGAQNAHIKLLTQHPNSEYEFKIK